jgi:hypothetical protein
MVCPRITRAHALRQRFSLGPAGGGGVGEGGGGEGGGGSGGGERGGGGGCAGGGGAEGGREGDSVTHTQPKNCDGGDRGGGRGGGGGGGEGAGEGGGGGGAAGGHPAPLAQTSCQSVPKAATPRPAGFELKIHCV